MTSFTTKALVLALLSLVSAQDCLTSAPAGPADAPFFQSVSNVQSNLAVLSSLVNGWQESDGLAGALVIQQSYYPLYSAVTSLQAVDPGTVAPNDVSNYVSSLNSLVGDISGLLGALNAKANALTNVGASQIVAGDISSLAGPASAINANAFNALPSNAPCDQVASGSALGSSLAGAFSGAAQTFSINGLPEFPVAPTACATYCGQSAGTSGAATSAAATSAAATSSAAKTSSAAAATSSAAKASSAAAATTSAAQPPAGSASATGPCVTSAAGAPINPAVDGAISTVVSSLDHLNSLVGAWNSNSGLPGALDIQVDYAPLYSAVMTLSSAVGNVGKLGPNDAASYLGPFGSLTSSIATLLSSLNAKAADFTAVGAGTIAAGDVKSLAGPASAIAASVFNAIPSDAPCPVVSSAGVIATSLGGAFAGAIKTFSIDGTPSFPSAPSACLPYCNGGGLPSGNSTSKAAATSGAAGSSKAAASSGAASSSKAAATSSFANATKSGTVPTTAGNATSKAATTAPGGQTSTVVVTAFTTYCPEPTTVCPGNGKCYTVTEATTLTVTDCPCTIVKSSGSPAPAVSPKPIPTKAPAPEQDTTIAVTAPVTLTRTAAKTSGASAPAVVPENTETAVAPSNGGSAVAGSLFAAVAGAVAVALL